MNFTIIKKIVLMSALFASLIVKEAYSITAAQAARQQQISAEIEKVLTKKVDESNYTDWTEEVNGLINKYKGVNVPDVQMKIKSLQAISVIQNKPESIGKKVEDTKELKESDLRAMLKNFVRDFALLDKRKEIGLKDEKYYKEFQKKFNDTIQQAEELEDPNLTITINDAKTIMQKIDELRKNQPTLQTPPNSNLNPSSKTLTKDDNDRALLKEISNLETEGDNILKVLEGGISGKTLDQNTFETWKNKAEDLIEKSATKPKPIPKAGENLSNLLLQIEKAILTKTSIPTPPTGPNIPSTPNLNPKEGPKLTEEQKINELTNRSLNSRNFNAWADDVKKVFKASENSTSQTIKEEITKLQNYLIKIEKDIYKGINKQFDKKFGDMSPQEYNDWKNSIQPVINDFNILWDLAGEIKVQRTENLHHEVKDIEQKITDEDNRRANVQTTTNQQNITHFSFEELKILTRISESISSSSIILGMIKAGAHDKTSINKWKKDAEEIINENKNQSSKRIKDKIDELQNILNTIEQAEKQPTSSSGIAFNYLRISQELINLRAKMLLTKTLEMFLNSRESLEKEIEQIANSISIANVSHNDKKDLDDALDAVKKDFFDKVISLLTFDSLLKLATTSTNLFFVVSGIIVTKNKMPSVGSDNKTDEILSNLQGIHNHCLHIFHALIIIQKDEKRDITEVKNLYNDLFKGLSGEDFDGKVIRTSVDKTITTTIEMITKNYIQNNPNKNIGSEKLFVTSVRDQIINILTLMIEIAEYLTKSTIINTDGIKKFRNTLQETKTNFSTAVTNIYGN